MSPTHGGPRMVLSRSTADRRRSGYTLLEMLLVLAVIAAIAGMGAIRWFDVLERQGVTSAAEEVRKVLDAARVRAVEEGRTLQFRFEPHGRHYVLLPEAPVDPADTSPSTSFTSLSDQDRQAETFVAFQLPEGCSFHVDNALLTGEEVVAERLTDDVLAHLENQYEVTDTVWSPAILFFPNGSATDGELSIIDRKRRYVRVLVRGLTGTTSVAQTAILPERFGTTSE